ncbi:MAG: hypothetical protein LBQ93_07850 [Treponema sp.]|nr:hypothetical protein [Treponema sp.]
MDLTAQIRMYQIGDQDTPFWMPIINTECDGGAIIDCGFHTYYKVNIGVYDRIKTYIRDNSATTYDYDSEKYLAITGGEWIGFFCKIKIVIEDEEVYYLIFRDVSLNFFYNLVEELSQEDDVDELLIHIRREIIARIEMEYSI